MLTSPPENDFRQHLEIETPEHVVLDYELAGIGSRSLAVAIDSVFSNAIALAVLLVAAFLNLGLAIAVLLWYLITSGYYTFFEGAREGQTPGKRYLGIRVIRDTGHAVAIPEAAARNIFRPLDLAVCGVFLIMLHPRGKRLGDMVAGTVVVRDKPIEIARKVVASAAPTRETEAELSLGLPVLSDQQFEILTQFIKRAPDLPMPTRDRFAGRLTNQFADKFPERHADNFVFLSALQETELARRQGKFGALVGQVGSTARRFVARKSNRWDEFHVLADRVNRRGLDGLTAEELPDFAGRYREVAADLARAKTYHADPVSQQRLERLVAAGHNALYRSERRTGRKIWEFVSRECPAEIVAQWRVILLAFALSVVPGIGTYAYIRSHPTVAERVVPENMLERAEAAEERLARGASYIEMDAEHRPLMAATIIVNNIKVSMTMFFGGILFGVGSLLALAINGMLIGAASGYYANTGHIEYLWTFILGHGVLELFAIWVAGAAGFRLGLAIIAPGELTRSDAMALTGRSSMRMMASVIIFLVIAGSIEGLISASDSGLTTRLMAATTSLIFLIAYLSRGRLRSP